jgi:NTE family protein
MKKTAAIAACAGCLLLPLSAWPRDEAVPAPPARPRIGLALAGGGARGAAHVGVLQMLEQLHVPVDYVAGTSMGAIIGGLYAAGLSADELREALLAIDWADALSDSPRRQDLSFRRKEDDRRYLFDLEGGIRDSRLRFPSGLRSGQKLGFLLERLTLSAASTDDFDRLPIPFRAVATDIYTGDPVVLGHGSLATALRASMAIPGVFTAVELDGRTLVDGGISNNLPVDVVRAMGADIVIAVDLRLPPPEEMASYLQITGQLSQLLTQKNMEVRLAQADVVIHPDVAGYGTMGFDKVAELCDLGRRQAEAQADELRRLAIPAEDHARLRAAQRRAAPPPPVIRAIRFAGNDRVDERVVRPLVQVDVGEPLDFADLERSLLGIYGLGYFQQVSFALAGEGSERELVIEMMEKPWGPHYLRAGVASSSEATAPDASFNLLVNLTSAPLDRRGAELRNDLVLGSELSLSTELYQPLSFRRNWFVAPRGGLRYHDVPFFEDGREVVTFGIRNAEAAVDLGYQFGHYAEARLGVRSQWVRAKVKRGQGELADDSVQAAGLETRWTLDRLDNGGIPTAGAYAQLSAFHATDALGSDEEYTQVALGVADWKSVGRGVLFGSLAGGVSPGSDLPIYAEFDLGGLLSLSGFADRELLGQEYGVARAGYYHRLRGKSLYAGGWLEAGNVWASGGDFGSDLITTITAALLLDSRLGPVILAYGRAEDGDDKVYLSIGRSP